MCIVAALGGHLFFAESALFGGLVGGRRLGECWEKTGVSGACALVKRAGHTVFFWVLACRH